MSDSSQSSDRFNALIGAAPDAILVIDHQGHIMVFNAAAERLFEYHDSEVIGKNVKVLMPEPYQSRHDDYLDRYQRTGIARIIGTGREVRAKKKNGDIFPIDLSVGEIKTNGKPEFVGIIRDLSERRAIEDQLAHQRDQLAHVARLGTLGEIATGLAHELNQPLAAISTYSNACSRMLANGNSDIAEILDDISANAKRAGDIIHRLRALIGDDTAQQAVHSVYELVQKSEQLAAPILRNHHVILSNEIEPDAGEVFVDDIHIQQIFLNLIKNASEAMIDNAGSRIIIIRARREHDRIMISISDNGPGVKPGAEQAIFQPFFSSKDDGLGVGLSLCKSLVNVNNGSLEAVNNSTGGLTVTMELPLV